MAYGEVKVSLWHTVFAVDNLEVLDGGLRDTPVKVEHIGSCVVVPHRCLVVQLNKVLHLSVLIANQKPLIVLHTRAQTRQTCRWVRMHIH